MMLSAIHVQSGHNSQALAQAEAQRHAELTQAIADHGHSHDDGEPDERLPGHIHGHNSTDHIHETANLVSPIEFGMPRFVRTVMRPASQGAEPGLPSTLDRPPRSVVG